MPATKVTFRLIVLAASILANADGSIARACAGLSKLERPFLAPPSDGPIVSLFGPRSYPALGYVRMHTGVDYAAELRDPVRAAAAGRVVIATKGSGYGKHVRLRHSNGYETTYAQLSKILVRKGDCVDVGAVIGKVGCAGGGTHLHFEVKQSGRYIDPAIVVGVRGGG